MTNRGRHPTIGLIWSQFSAYHVDRLEAVGRRLAGRARVLSVEVASKSATYAWDPSGEVAGTEKIRLFPGESHERISIWRRFRAEWTALRACDVVFVGVAYSQPDIILLSYVLRALGKRVVMMTASKFDDFQRKSTRELFKRLLLSPYSAAIVGGRRQFEYVRFLGFDGRPVLPGYNTVSMERVRHQAESADARSDATPFDARSFVFVGRFVEKKNIERMLKAYASYVHAHGGPHGAGVKRLTMIGDGPLRAAIDARCADLGIAEMVDFPGFLPADQVSARLARSLALVLVSEEEQWGLVINEALAVGLPILASAEVGAREALVRNLENGIVVEAGALEGIARAFGQIADNEAAWQAMSSASRARSWHADTERFADAVELMVFPGSEPAAANHARFASEILIDACRVACV
ncbi:glycosyltransferase [Novosphingobium huizhouense]|uniref:glycosyltransferase n=1 Tax=Novosphingobium huizhouense TaxID=2866625 RepID=UPI001CD903E3|nr:glycosyltransferase [Novosphingobium huizhouense]